MSFAADGQSFAALCAATLQDQTPVLGAHADQKSVSFAAVTSVGLKRALTLHGIPSEENEPSIVTKAF